MCDIEHTLQLARASFFLIAMTRTRNIGE